MRLAVAMGLSMTVGIVTVRFLYRRAPILTAKCHVHHPKHIEGRDERGNDADQPIHPACIKGLPKNLVLGPEASERRDPCNCERGNPHRRKRPGHVNPQTAHLAQLLLANAAVEYT